MADSRFQDSGSPRQRAFFAVTVLLAVVAAYANSLPTPFLFDDAGAVVHNPTIRRLWSTAVLSPPADGSTTTGRPVVNLSYALNYALTGANVWSYHAVNIALHALSSILLLGLVRRTLRLPSLRPRFGSAASAVAFSAALLWALHPLATESVTGIAQRTESLCGFFYLLTLYAFVRGGSDHSSDDNPPDAPPVRRETSPAHQNSSRLRGLVPWSFGRWSPPRRASLGLGPRRRTWAAVSVAACLAGMGTKEVMVTAPLLVWLYDRTFVAGSFAAAWRCRRGFYLALATTWLLLAWLVLQSGGARGVAAGFGRGVSPWHYLLTQCEALVLYVRLSLWPHPLVIDYGNAVVRSPAEVWWQGLIVLSALAGTVWALVRRPIPGFLGAAWFLLLAPSSSFVPLVTQTIAEHRVYLPLAALAIGSSLALHALVPRPAGWLTAALAAAFAFLTLARNHDYRNPVALWRSSVAAHPTSARAHNNLAHALQTAGQPAEAERHYARAVQLDPRYVSARYNWGVALLEQNRPADAIEHLAAAVQLAPDYADAHLNLGNALVRVHRPADALPHFERALALGPAADAHYNLAVALLDLNRNDAAATHLRAALQLDPELAAAHHQLGRLAERTGRPAEALAHYSAALRLAPDHLDTHRRLGLLLAGRADYTGAAFHFEAIIRLQPSDADAHANLGNALLLQGQPRAAIARYEEALRLRPDDPRTRENLRLAHEALR